jgi:hypothetical protein
MEFCSVAVLRSGETPWTYIEEPSQLLGAWRGETVEDVLDDVARRSGDDRLSSGRVAWWDRGEVLYVVPLTIA